MPLSSPPPPDAVPPDALLFDLDGTLLDTRDDLTAALNRALQQHRRPLVDDEFLPRAIGNGSERLVRRALHPHDADDALVRDVHASFLEAYTAHLAIHTTPYPGITDLLDALSRRSHALGVLSNKPHPFTRRLVDHLLPQARFEAVAGAKPGVPRKPDPTAALEMARHLDARPQHTWFIGDTATDIHTARAAGMIPVGVLWGFRDRDELLEAGAIHLLDHPRTLLERLDSP